MRRLELLIDAARSESLNKEYSTTIGIPQDDFVRWANEAQDRLHSEVTKTHPNFFLGETDVSVVAGQESYSLPANCHLGMLELVEYSYDGTEANFKRLERASLPERMSHASGHPSYYIPRNSEILLAPTPASSGGVLRIVYVKKPKLLDIRRAQVLSTTFAGGVVTDLTLSSRPALDPTGQLDKVNHLSVVSRSGAQKMAGLEYDGINAVSHIVAISGGAFTAQAGESIAVTDYVVTGQDSANVSDLPEFCDRYLKAWMVYKAMDRDGSALAPAKKAAADEMLADVIGAFSDREHDVTHVTILNTDFMSFGGFDA